ncbi:DUF3054 domain-containing protein [Microbacterium sp. Bi121]|uniref:DUF3054 domain-containing protein n=1 Tax=Microbacterium sp. Bi121 TaxID=2822348 RepID=UPI001E4C947F|nr:DUF3054 domain-containing protein [Microbacterium sp. Bi121]
MVILIDLVLVVVFCVIGRLSHAEGIFGDLPGLMNTIWPFAVAALIAHAALLLRRARPDRMLPGLLVWAVTVVLGLLLRAVSGQGTAVPFIIVATLTLALFLLGWRAVAALVRRARARSAS